MYAPGLGTLTAIDFHIFFTECSARGATFRLLWRTTRTAPRLRRLILQPPSRRRRRQRVGRPGGWSSPVHHHFWRQPRGRRRHSKTAGRQCTNHSRRIHQERQQCQHRGPRLPRFETLNQLCWSKLKSLSLEISVQISGQGGKPSIFEEELVLLTQHCP